MQKISFGLALLLLSACSSSPDSSSSSQKVNRAGRPYKEIRGLSSFPMDTNTLYKACLKERDTTYCNNRLGR
jgi:hypothetical protein